MFEKPLIEILSMAFLWLIFRSACVIMTENQATEALLSEKGTVSMPNRIKNKPIDAKTSVANLSNTGENDVRSIVLEGLGAIRGDPVSELSSQISSAGDIRMDSSEAEVIIVTLEERLGCKLPKPSSLRAEQFTSVSSLTDVVMQKMRAASSARPAKTPTKVIA